MAKSTTPPGSDETPTLKHVLKCLGRHREKERQRIFGPQEEYSRLSEEMDAIINSPEMKEILKNPIMKAVLVADSPPTIAPEAVDASALGNLGPKIVKIRKRLEELEPIVEARLARWDKPKVARKNEMSYWDHPLCWLCTQLEEENLCDPKNHGEPLERQDLEHAAFRLSTTIGWRKHTEIGPDDMILTDWPELLWLGPELTKLDNNRVGERLYRQLVEQWPEVMAECGLNRFVSDSEGELPEAEAEGGVEGKTAEETDRDDATNNTVPPEGVESLNTDEVDEPGENDLPCNPLQEKQEFDSSGEYFLYLSADDGMKVTEIRDHWQGMCDVDRQAKCPTDYFRIETDKRTKNGRTSQEALANIVKSRIQTARKKRPTTKVIPGMR